MWAIDFFVRREPLSLHPAMIPWLIPDSLVSLFSGLAEAKTDCVGIELLSGTQVRLLFMGRT